MKVIVLIQVLISCVFSSDVCPNTIHFNNTNLRIRTSYIDERECSQITFSTRESFNNDLALVQLKAYFVERNEFMLNISFLHVLWRKAYIRLSESDGTNNICKMYSSEFLTEDTNSVQFYDTCFKIIKSVYENYILDYKAESEATTNYMKMVFKPPSADHFNDSVPLRKREIFTYIDASKTYELVLKIQALPQFYGVQYYKVDVYREKHNRETLLDVRLIPTNKAEEYMFQYVTYNVEGYYYFKVSAVSVTCTEDNSCEKSVTPKVYISKRSSPLVIGIVGASLIIPIILAIFHMWTRKYKNNEDSTESKYKILLIYKPASEKFNTVIRTFARTIENLIDVEVMLDPVVFTKTKQNDSEKWCSDNLLLASHIFYVCSLETYKLDFMTYTYLLEETKKSIPEKDIFVIMLPFSFRDVPSYLSKCLVFELMEDFGKLMNVFETSVDFKNNPDFVALNKEIEDIQNNEEYIKMLRVPRIVITEQSDSSDNELKESDGLL